MSGQFSSLKELHQFVREEITTVDGELARDDFLNTYYWKAKPVLMKGGGLLVLQKNLIYLWIIFTLVYIIDTCRQDIVVYIRLYWVNS